jgi:ubiquinone/menaquinone biosynthesis C-methylase UbiE
MRQDLYRDLYTKENHYWWHVGKRMIVHSLIEKYLPDEWRTQSLSSLDLGCGTGLNLEHLERYGRAVGTDYSEEALRFCRERGHTLLCKADAGALPFPDAQFHIATALDVIEHLDDDVVAFEELRRVLRPGGLLIVTVPAYAMLWTYWDDILGHRRRYTTRTMRDAAKRAGLRIRSVTYSNTLTMFPAVGVRMVKSLMHHSAKLMNVENEPETDFISVPDWANNTLIAYYKQEARMLTNGGLPFGLSVVCVAQRPWESSR